jgi:hypothetical protein
MRSRSIIAGFVRSTFNRTEGKEKPPGCSQQPDGQALRSRRNVVSTSVANPAAAVNGAVRRFISRGPIQRYSEPLAREIGEKPMLLLLQLDYLLAQRGVQRHGALRIRATIADVQKWFPWSQPTVRRLIDRMIEAGLLDAVQERSVDRARWLTFGRAVASLQSFSPAQPQAFSMTRPFDRADHIERNPTPLRPTAPATGGSVANDHVDHMATGSRIVIQDSDQVKDQDHVALARENAEHGNDVQEIWETTKVSLLAMVSPMNHKLYIAPLQLGGVGAGTVSLVAPNSFTASGAGRYRSTIRAALIERLGNVTVAIATRSSLHFA